MDHLRVKRRGSHRTICFLENSNGECPAEEFLGRPEKALAKAAFKAQFDLISEHPRTDIPTSTWKPLRSKKSRYSCSGFSELRHLGSKSRLFMFHHRCGNEEFEIITHGITKKEDDLDDAEIKRIIDARDYFLSQHKCPEPIEIKATRKAGKQRRTK